MDAVKYEKRILQIVQIEDWNEWNMENPLLKYLALVKTVETGSFTRAAQALNYAQSSVARWSRIWRRNGT